jgi:hypothetical protein
MSAPLVLERLLRLVLDSLSLPVGGGRYGSASPLIMQNLTIDGVAVCVLSSLTLSLFYSQAWVCRLVLSLSLATPLLYLTPSHRQNTKKKVYPHLIDLLKGIKPNYHWISLNAAGNLSSVI